MSDLLPCPFCGASQDADLDIADTGVFWVRCGECCAEGTSTDTREEAVAAWNKRAALPAVVAQETPSATPDLRRVLADNQSLLETIYRLNTHGSVREHDWEEGGVGDLISKRISANRAALAAQPEAPAPGQFAKNANSSSELSGQMTSTKAQWFCEWLQGFMTKTAGRDELDAFDANTIRNTLNECMNSSVPSPGASCGKEGER